VPLRRPELVAHHGQRAQVYVRQLDEVQRGRRRSGRQGGGARRKKGAGCAIARTAAGVGGDCARVADLRQ